MSVREELRRIQLKKCCYSFVDAAVCIEEGKPRCAVAETLISGKRLWTGFPFVEREGDLGGKMGFPVFPNICTGLLPMIIINIAVCLTSMKRTFNVFLNVLGFSGQPSSTHYDAANIIFPEEYDSSAGLAFCGFSDEVLQALPLAIYDPDITNVGMDMECPVCLSEFERGQEIRLLPACKHAYHRHCLDKWLGLQRMTCPVCRASLVPEDIAKTHQRRDQQISEDIFLWFSSFPGAGFPSFWCYT